MPPKRTATDNTGSHKKRKLEILEDPNEGAALQVKGTTRVFSGEGIAQTAAGELDGTTIVSDGKWV